jgi:hypothetical protein
MEDGYKVKNAICLLVIAYFSICVSNVFAASKPEFTIKIGTLIIDGVKDAGIADRCTSFELTERINAGGILDADSNYIVYICYDKNNIYFACDAVDDVVISSDVAESDYRDSDYIRFYLATEDDFEGITVLTKTQYAFVWTPQDKDGKWNPQMREVSKISYGGVGHPKLDGDAAAEFINSKSGTTDDGWYIEAAIGWDVLGVKNEEKELLGRIVGVMFISGDTDQDKEGPAVQEREGEARLASDKTASGNYWSSPDHFRVAELENGKFAVEPSDKLAISWGIVKTE